MIKKTIFFASISGVLGVTLGDFGAHGLTNIVTENELMIWNKAVLYQFIHTFAVLYIGLLLKFNKSKLLKSACLLFMFGILLFSGSLYLLIFSKVANFGLWKSVLGPITPLGGLLFIAGWICLFLFALKFKDDEK